MSWNGRELLYTRDRVRQMFARMREELQEMHYRHASELVELRCELNQVRSAYEGLRAVVLQRQKAEAELDHLYREREIARAQAVWRDFGVRLH